MAVATNRYSSGSESSNYPGSISRQGTISSRDGGYSVRQSKRLSTTAFYMSVSAKDKDVEIDDELARGTYADDVGTEELALTSE